MAQEQPLAKKIWFPAKRYGLGWGSPVAWQGWLVLIIYFILLVSGTLLLSYHGSMMYYLLYVFIITFILLIICYIKGEKLG
ncbi:hypothetical protein ACF3NA_03535 [Alkanindiges sp. WGS2144]|uniref:hypothetical protein n=1 Tax=Alkanindiges sp. WGS2144 TaxID=3366808 RepID=UPI003752F7FB